MLGTCSVCLLLMRERWPELQFEMKAGFLGETERIAILKTIAGYQCGRRLGSCFSRLGICRFMNSLKSGTVKAVSPWR